MTGAAQPPPTSKARAARLSAGINATLAVLKFAAALATGSISVLSDAVHSTTDVIAATVTWYSVVRSEAPPDADHPFGHGKYESISGLVEGCIVLAAAGFMLLDAVTHLLALHRGAALPLLHPGFATGVMTVSLCSSLWLNRALYGAASSTDSPALMAEARHMLTDVLTSAAVIVGLIVSQISGAAGADAVAALVVVAVIAQIGVRILRDATQPLLDSSLPQEEEAKIIQILNAHPAVLGYHKLRTRRAGSERHADVHVQLDDDCTLVQAHTLTEELEDSIRAALPAMRITIHTEPFRAELEHQAAERRHDSDP
ncbi:MAG: cation transporter [Armatimonadetes bacterium]|nr:cation transporter [Armatimonadota bacterium]MDE2205671.1 cation transporter [Armatimonadota bacterium]